MSPIKFYPDGEKSAISQRGASLYFSIIILSILLAIVLGLTAILVGQTRMIKGMGDSVASFYGADTAIERILYQDKLCRQAGCESLGWVCVDTANCDEGLSSLESPVSGNIGPVNYTAIFNDGATTITAIGMYSGTRRAIQVNR